MPPQRRWVSRAVSNIGISAIKEMAIRSAQVKDAASLTWGVPSFRTPEYIRSAVSSALEPGDIPAAHRDCLRPVCPRRRAGLSHLGW
jgi:hypothetical protein